MGSEIEWIVGSLATAWEKDDVLRSRGRANDCLSRWLSPKTKGIPGMQAITLNIDALLHIAKLWCPLMPFAKSPPIPLLRAEAHEFKVVNWKSVYGYMKELIWA